MRDFDEMKFQSCNKHKLFYLQELVWCIFAQSILWNIKGLLWHMKQI